MTVEFRQAVRRLEGGDLNALPEVVSLAKAAVVGPDSVAFLAFCLARSGSVLRNRPLSADIASTGGPGSLTTLLCPLLLRTYGCVVPKVAVQGRPAGGVDVLGSLDGYRVDLDVAEAESCLDGAGYVHLIAGDRFAPLDARLFALRQRSNAQSIPALVAASLLSKKIAAGSPVAGLDVRVGPHGNFGRDPIEAESNVQLFEASAEACGLKPVSFVTETTGIEQPWIGRGEALSALDLLFSGEADEWLLRHVRRCTAMAATVAQGSGVSVESDTWSTALAELARDAMRTNLESQGSSLGALRERAAAVRRSGSIELRAQCSGVVEIDIGGLRSALVDAQIAAGGQFPDPAGVRLLAESGAEVERSAQVAIVRCEMHRPGPTLDRLESAISVSGVPTTATERAC